VGSTGAGVVLGVGSAVVGVSGSVGSVGPGGEGSGPALDPEQIQFQNWTVREIVACLLTVFLIRRTILDGLFLLSVELAIASRFTIAI